MLLMCHLLWRRNCTAVLTQLLSCFHTHSMLVGGELAQNPFCFYVIQAWNLPSNMLIDRRYLTCIDKQRYTSGNTHAHKHASPKPYAAAALEPHRHSRPPSGLILLRQGRRGWLWLPWRPPQSEHAPSEDPGVEWWTCCLSALPLQAPLCHTRPHCHPHNGCHFLTVLPFHVWEHAPFLNLNE